MSIQDLQLRTHNSQIKFALDLDPENSSDRFVLGEMQHGVCYEPDVALMLMRALKPGDTAVDIGANIGFFTIIMSRLVGKTGTVIACEPSPENLGKMKLNFQINEPGSHNIQVVREPLWFQDEMVTFWHNADHTSSGSLYDPAVWHENVKSKANPQPEEMRAITLDSLRLKPKLIKIDTEGAELPILQGARETLIRHRPPYVVVEFNPIGMNELKYTAEMFRAYMRQFGYELFFLHRDTDFPTLVPPNTEVKFVDDIRVINVLFSSQSAVSEAWPEAYE